MTYRSLVLFDIDGTLVHSDGAGKASMLAAMRQVYGTEGGLATFSLHGMTDRQIVYHALADNGLSQSAIDSQFERLGNLMAQELRQAISSFDVRPCAGGLDLVQALKTRGDVLVGLVTGNFEATAYIKLAAAGYAPGDFFGGAFGSENADRNALPPLAVERAEKLSGQHFSGQSIVIVGDTPADIVCARSVKARVVAVAMGRHTPTDLAAHQPDVVLADFSDRGASLAAILPAL